MQLSQLGLRTLPEDKVANYKAKLAKLQKQNEKAPAIVQAPILEEKQSDLQMLLEHKRRFDDSQFAESAYRRKFEESLILERMQAQRKS